jgi:hypothetical protein
MKARRGAPVAGIGAAGVPQEADHPELMDHNFKEAEA